MTDTKLGALIVYNRKHIHIINTRNADSKCHYSSNNEITDFIKEHGLNVKITEKAYPFLISVGFLAVREMIKREIKIGYSITKCVVISVKDIDPEVKPFEIVKDNDSHLHPLKDLSRDRVYDMIMSRPDAPKTFRVYSYGFDI